MEKKKDVFVGIWLTPDTKTIIEQAARDEGRTVSGFGRFHLTRLAEQATREQQPAQVTR